MDTLDALLSRKSVRSYTGEKINRSQLETIIKAAYASPAAKARFDTLHLSIIEDEEILDQLDNVAAKFIGTQAHPLYGAPTFILVSSAPTEEELGNVEYSNAAILVHSMGLAATDLGVGCCYIWGAVRALNANPNLVNKLDLPEGAIPCCGIVLGVTEDSYHKREVPENRISTSFC